MAAGLLFLSVLRRTWILGREMYAVIRAGGKQFKVAKGDVIEVDRLKGSDEVRFTPLLVVDDDGTARSGKAELSAARVIGRVVGDAKGPKIDVTKYRNKTGYRRHAGHRQRYTSVQIADIELNGADSTDASATTGGSDDGS
jgi:large subunit ribosomal protein L21